MSEPLDLNKFRTRTYSQNGEDGMCLRMFETLGITKPTYCEIGAGDGRELSNTRLFYERGARGAMIEGDLSLFIELKSYRPGDYLVNEYVDCEENNTLDYWLGASALAHDFDLLSLDIDGNDIWVWESMEVYKPKAVLVEYNYSLKESLTIAYDPKHRFMRDNYYGATAAALCKLGSAKGYVLVGFTPHNNLLFLRTDLAYGFRHYDVADVPTGGGWPQSNRIMIPY